MKLVVLDGDHINLEGSECYSNTDQNTREPQTKCRAITPQGSGQDQIQGTAGYDTNNTRLRIHPYTRTEYRSNKNKRRTILIDDHFQAIGRSRGSRRRAGTAVFVGQLLAVVQQTYEA